MPAMTESEATVEAVREASTDPRRTVLADLVAHLAVGVIKQARCYETAAAHADGLLRETLDELGRRKHDQAADLLPLSRALGVPAPSVPTPTPPESTPAWGVVLGEAFQGERALEATGRQLAVLAQEPALRDSAARLAAGAARDGGEVRKLYLRYT